MTLLDYHRKALKSCVAILAWSATLLVVTVFCIYLAATQNPWATLVAPIALALFFLTESVFSFVRHRRRIQELEATNVRIPRCT